MSAGNGSLDISSVTTKAPSDPELSAAEQHCWSRHPTKNTDIKCIHFQGLRKVEEVAKIWKIKLIISSYKSRETSWKNVKFIYYDKVITTMVIRLLNNWTYCARSALTRLGLWRTLYGRLFMESLHHQPMCSEMCSLDIFIDLQPFGCNLKGGLFDPPSPQWGVRGCGWSRIGPFDSPPMCSY